MPDRRLDLPSSSRIAAISSGSGRWVWPRFSPSRSAWTAAARIRCWESGVVPQASASLSAPWNPTPAISVSE